MTCDDADQLWHEILDRRSVGVPSAQGRVADHVSHCTRCRAVSARFQLLAAALDALEPPPAPTPALRSRFLLAARANRRKSVLGRTRWLVPALAASILAVAWWSLVRSAPKRVPVRPRVELHLASALADATSATVELARGVSGPAARIGLDVLDLEGGEIDATARTFSDDKPVEPAPDLLQSVGDRLDAGTRPFSGTALHAFGFLLPKRSEADRPPPPDEPARVDP